MQLQIAMDGAGQASPCDARITKRVLLTVETLIWVGVRHADLVMDKQRSGHGMGIGMWPRDC